MRFRRIDPNADDVIYCEELEWDFREKPVFRIPLQAPKPVYI